MKKKLESQGNEPSPKKIKIEKKNAESSKKGNVANQKQKPQFAKKSDKSRNPTNLKEVKAKQFKNNAKANPLQKVLGSMPEEKVEDWKEFKELKKKLKEKRKEKKNKNEYNIIMQAKNLGEELRKKSLSPDKRQEVIEKLHNLLKGKDRYAKFVLSHDMARIVQWLLKYASENIIHEISLELIPVTVDMMQSKYGVHCVKRLLKYGQSDIRTNAINAMQGHAVKLASHAISSPILEYAFTTWANPLQKRFLIQEFYSDLYKKSKDKDVKHLNDAYKNDNTMKKATLDAVKVNLQRILNKSLLDSTLVHAVLHQYLQECSEQDRSELIAQLIPHIVVLSNSKDGSRVAMRCIWSGSNKDKKAMMKSLKEYLVELAKHEYGYCTVITLLDSVDDTVLLHKIIISELLKNAKDLAVSEYGRKVLLWLVAPEAPMIFHPTFVNELKEGREHSTCKKTLESRRKEIFNYSIDTLMDLIANETEFWLSNSSLAVELLNIVISGSGERLQKSIESLVEVIVNPSWRVKEEDNEIQGIEHSGMHLVLKKLAQHGKDTPESAGSIFRQTLLDKLTNSSIEEWLKHNRSGFVLVHVLENGTSEDQDKLTALLKSHKKTLKKSDLASAKILCKKLNLK